MLTKTLENFKKHYNSQKQVSLTGARALAIFMTLLDSPKTYEEINDILTECGVITKGYSPHTLRMDINTLKAVGCEISKAVKSEFNRYGLKDHPFRIVISPKEIDSIKKVYELVCKHASLQKLLDYHSFFNHLKEITDDKSMKYEIQDISVLKNSNIMLLEKLAANEKIHNKIRVSYQPSSFEDYEYDITIERYEIKDDELYVHCYNHTLDESSFLNAGNVKRVINSAFDPDIETGLPVYIRFKLYSPEQYLLNDNEIISKKGDDYIIAAGRYYDNFTGIQRMLSFGLNCAVLEPKEIKTEVINKLREMKGLYGKK